MAVPKRYSLPMREIWMLQLRLERKGGKRSLRVLGHPRFRAAYDFLLLRAAAGEGVLAIGSSDFGGRLGGVKISLREVLA